MEGQNVFEQCKDGGPWTHAIVVENLGPMHEYRSYDARLTTSGIEIVCNIKHLKPTPITAESFKSSQQPTVMTTEQLIDYLNSRQNIPIRVQQPPVPEKQAPPVEVHAPTVERALSPVQNSNGEADHQRYRQ